MASRMDRYNNDSVQGRSSRNKNLYRQIEDLDSYTNIEGVATIEKNNEIDISKVKEMLKNRENYKKQKELGKTIEEEKDVYIEPKEETRNYDINDILSKIKEEPKEDVKYRSLNKEQYNTLKSLNKKGKEYDIEKEEDELKELINTLTATKALTKDDPNDVGLLDELKSDTMVGDVSSIKKIIEEEKEMSKKDTSDDKEEIDKSFYTSSFGFTKKDFDELKSMNHNIKKSNKFIIILLIVLIVVIIVGVIYFVLI